MLTTKVQKDFTDWIIKKDNFHILMGELCFKAGATVDWKLLPIEMQFGIYQDYFWQVDDTWISVRPTYANDKDHWAYFLKGIDLHHINSGIKETPDEARKTAIQEASELLEDRL